MFLANNPFGVVLFWFQCLSHLDKIENTMQGFSARGEVGLYIRGRKELSIDAWFMRSYDRRPRLKLNYPNT